MMKTLLTIAAILISSISYGQGIWTKSTANVKQNRLMADSVLIVPRDTGSTNLALYQGSPVGDSGRIAFIGGKFWGFTSFWEPLGSGAIDTTSLSSRIDQKLNISDTAAMLSPYLRSADTTGHWKAASWLPGVGDVTGLQDSLNESTLQRATERGNITTVPITASRITSNNFIPSNIAQGAIDITRDIDDAGMLNARGFRDNTIFRRGSAIPVVPVPGQDYYSYANFDAAGGLEGSNFDHVVAFQARPFVNITGNVRRVYSAFFRPEIISGTVDSCFNVQIANPSGPVVKNRLLYLESATAGTSENYSIYSNGGTSFFSGDLKVGTTGGTDKTVIRADVVGNTRIQVHNNDNTSTSRSGVRLTTQNGSWLIDAVRSGGLNITTPSASDAIIINNSGNLGILTTPSSTLHSGGSIATAVPVMTTGNIILTASHYAVLISNTSHVVTLPSASSAAGRIYIMVNYNTGGNVTISSVNRNGSTTTSLPDNAKWTIQSDGTNWYVIQD